MITCPKCGSSDVRKYFDTKALHGEWSCYVCNACLKRNPDPEFEKEGIPLMVLPYMSYTFEVWYYQNKFIGIKKGSKRYPFELWKNKTELWWVDRDEKGKFVQKPILIWKML